MNRASNKTNTAAEPTHLHQHAEENLRFIRASMESASSFTGVSGKGYIAGGLSAIAASWLAAQQATLQLWLSVWMLELVLAAAVMLIFTLRKSEQQGAVIFSSASGKKLLLAFLPAMSAGAILTLYFVRQELISALPIAWLSIYGAAVITAGAYSVKAIPLMGIMFLLLGALAACTTINPNILLGLGFGILHLIFGAYIWSRHGG